MPDAEKKYIPAEQVSTFALLVNVLPLFVLVILIVASFTLVEKLSTRAGLFFVMLYTILPLIARLLLLIFGKPEGRAITQNSRSFRLWWVLLQLQMPFNRLPLLEELLRLVPGIYPLWLNLWGAQVHPATFWGPGARILDRPYLKTGYGSIIGTDTLMSGHLSSMEKGRFLVDIATIKIGSHAIIGARSSIGPGCVIEAGETLTATSRLAPFDHYVNGKRQ